MNLASKKYHKKVVSKYRNNFNNKVCIIPMHREIARGTLKSILEQADITIEEFLNQM